MNFARCVATAPDTKKPIKNVIGFFERCVPLRKRSVHFVRDVCFASDVPCGA